MVCFDNAASPSVSRIGFQVRLREIIADEEQSAGMILRKFVGKTIAKIQTGRVSPFARLRIGLGNSAGGCLRDGDNAETESLDQDRHLVGDVSLRRDYECLCQSAGGDQYFVLRFQKGDAAIGFRLPQYDGHEGRRIDNDHFGKPSSS